jgi:MFS transporter, FSR family, fosmidomycin resistance protein
MSSPSKPAFGVILAICACHAINDMLQSLLPAMYPTVKEDLHLTFAQLGAVTLTCQLTASLLQPLVGLYADRRPSPAALPGGTLFTLVGLIVLATARDYPLLLAGAMILGVGSSIFHPESSRVARMAGGDRPGMAQSLFQVGGNVGGALGPLGAAFVVVRWGRQSLAAFALLALVSTAILSGVSVWYERHGLAKLEVLRARTKRGDAGARRTGAELTGRHVARSLAVLLVLVFSKFAYMASFTNYYTFYLIHRFGVSVASAQLHLVVFMASIALGTFAGGPIGDRVGRKWVIWFSILGVLPFTLALPFASLFWTGVLSAIIGVLLASAFPAIVVYGQELMPGRIGLVSGLFFGLSFGTAGACAALLGELADATSIETVYRLCAFLPALGLLGGLLPDLGERAARNRITGEPGRGPAPPPDRSRRGLPEGANTQC